ncbi:hypothetical protein [Synoicihabitans lomoniglobus]|uniref:hypothetical protein n=1 Tax=Synoicihabitans lomoniglobus TaxID=2909285 RepID=UPI002ED268CC|nr:hypothetical protein [Opitutaceae bacterium LMO-M01]
MTAQQITALGDEGWGDQSGSTGNSFGDYSYEFTESGPLGENAVRLVATGTGEQAALATLEQFSGLKIAEFDGLDYSIESVLGTYSAWAETAAAGSMPNLKISLYISDTSYTASQVVDRLDTEDLEWAKTLVYLPGGSTPTSGSWESFDVSSADWWWTGASQAHQSFDSWIPDVFDYVDGLPTPAYLYIGSIQFGLGGSSNENLLTGYVDEMDVSFGSAGSFTYDFGASAVPEPAHFALGLSMLALASGVMRRNRLRPEY